MTSSHPFSASEYSERLRRIRLEMATLGLGSVITSNQANIRYVTGFRGEPHTLLVTETEAILYTSFRTLPWAEQQTFGMGSQLELSTVEPPLRDIALRLDPRGGTVAVDRTVSHLAFRELQGYLPGIELTPCGPIERVRGLKSPAEVALLERSQRLNEEIFAAVLPQIAPGMSERAVQGVILSEIAKREEVDGYSFTPIVAAGGNAWEIHHLPDLTEIQRHDMLLLDLGVIYQGYASDMTRTICMGKATSPMREVYETVRRAQEEAIASMRPGIGTHAVDQVAREIIIQAGHGRSFTHGLGHSIGLQTHDPGLNLSTAGPDELLAVGMAFTVEPGIYLPAAFGVRIEDVVVVTEGGNKNITQYPKSLIELNS